MPFIPIILVITLLVGITEFETDPQMVTVTLHQSREFTKKHLDDLPYTVDEYIVTAYTAGPESTGKTPDHPAYGITTSGAYVKEGVTIACPPELPLGTGIYIEDVGWRVCQDRGGAIKGKKLDLYIENLSEALSWGRPTKKVYLPKDF